MLTPGVVVAITDSLVLVGLVMALASRGRARTAGPAVIMPSLPATVNVERGGIESELATNDPTAFAAANDLAFTC